MVHDFFGRVEQVLCFLRVGLVVTVNDELG
jgi:hypothetical protein